MHSTLKFLEVTVSDIIVGNLDISKMTKMVAPKAIPHCHNYNAALENVKQLRIKLKIQFDWGIVTTWAMALNGS